MMKELEMFDTNNNDMVGKEFWDLMVGKEYSYTGMMMVLEMSVVLILMTMMVGNRIWGNY